VCWLFSCKKDVENFLKQLEIYEPFEEEEEEKQITNE